MLEQEIQEIAKSFASHYEQRAALKNNMDSEKASMVSYAKDHPHAFDGRRLHFRKGVFVQLTTRQYVRFTKDKVNNSWIERMAAAGNAAALVIRLDPKKLQPTAETMSLLNEIDYQTDTKEVAGAGKKKQYELFDDEETEEAKDEGENKDDEGESKDDKEAKAVKKTILPRQICPVTTAPYHDASLAGNGTS
jgi:hypothetical protein